jgi:Hypoxia induced protein conserved region
MTLANILFVLVIVSGLATLGMLFAGLVNMARNTENTVEGGKRSNRFMWWRVRLQFLTIILILLWWYVGGRS